jgi:hypothetical protein
MFQPIEQKIYTVDELLKISPSSKIKANSKNLPLELKNKSHSIQIDKKQHPTKNYGNSVYYFKKIHPDENSNLRLSASLAIAESEVFFQELRRALCPTHLFKKGEKTYNLFTKYRVGFDFNTSAQREEDLVNVYVVSKGIDFISDSVTLLQCLQSTFYGSTPGLPAVAFLGKYCGDMDLKFSNIGLVVHDRGQESEFVTYTQIDSGCCLAGNANFSYRNSSDYIGHITSDEITINPSTNLNIYNYLWLRWGNKPYHEEYQKFPKTSNEITNRMMQYLIKAPQIYQKMSEQNYAIQETVITALRCACVPPIFINDLLKSYFNSTFSESIWLANKTQKALLTHQKILKESCSKNVNFIRYFFSIDSLSNSLFRKELQLLLKSMTEFTKYKKIKVNLQKELQYELLCHALTLLHLTVPNISSAMLIGLFNEVKKSTESSSVSEFDTEYNRMIFSLDPVIHAHYHKFIKEELSVLCNKNKKTDDAINSLSKNFITDLYYQYTKWNQIVNEELFPHMMSLKNTCAFFLEAIQYQPRAKKIENQVLSILKIIIPKIVDNINISQAQELILDFEVHQDNGLVYQKLKSLFVEELTKKIVFDKEEMIIKQSAQLLLSLSRNPEKTSMERANRPA